MGKQWWQFIVFSLVLTAIILSSVIFGGYSSLHRSEKRINITKGLFLDACRNKLDLVQKLIDSLNDIEPEVELTGLKHTRLEAKQVLDKAFSNAAPLDDEITHKLEISQSALTEELKKTLLNVDKLQDKNKKQQFTTIKQQLYSAQDKVTLEKIRYNVEVSYFNRRSRAFPLFFIARLFEFDKSKYYELGQNYFLSAEKVYKNKSE